ncbi:hypothetical protein AAG570_013035 [Ranatra chinensis]|uniref:Uncharacterized protein n=1 Tax=Ranatra chinensis TaxID=642074 RepID=A0ABD0YFL5_9HEMI
MASKRRNMFDENKQDTIFSREGGREELGRPRNREVAGECSKEEWCSGEGGAPTRPSESAYLASVVGVLRTRVAPRPPQSRPPPRPVASRHPRAHPPASQRCPRQGHHSAGKFGRSAKTEAWSSMTVRDFDGTQRLVRYD